ncbi:MAG: hypothetical protein ACPGUV_06870 [Polyangiales bacterium]
MRRDFLLDRFGYDPALYRQLSAESLGGLQAVATAWLVACVLLGSAGAYGAWLVLPALWTPLLGGLSVTLLAVNLLRVVTAGGGCHVGLHWQASRSRCRRYRPSLIPAAVLGVLAAILSLPAQLPFWPELGPQVDAHRHALLARHASLTAHRDGQVDYFRQELETAAFPVFRIQRMLHKPARMLRYSALYCAVMVLLALWGRFFALSSVRAYEWQRCRRAHAAMDQLYALGEAQAADALSLWPSYQSPSPWPRAHPRPALRTGHKPARPTTPGQ